jgi:hypothetical protein
METGNKRMKNSWSRMGIACLLLLGGSSIQNSGGLWEAGVDWLLLTLFFVMRNMTPWGVFLMGLSVGLLVSMLNMGSWAEWIFRAEWASFLVYFLYPLIRWDYPRNAILAFWSVMTVYLFGVWGVKEFLGEPQSIHRIVQDTETEINTGIMAAFLILGIYGTRLLRGWMPVR